MSSAETKTARAPRVVAWGWWPRLLAESALIVFSVLFALAMDRWLEGRERVAEARMAVASIRSEIEVNTANVERAGARHRAMRDSLLRYLSLRRPPPREVYRGGIFNPAATYAVAWESARESGVLRDLPHDLVLALARTYERQTLYRALADALVQDMMMQVRREGPEPVFRDAAAHFITLQEDFAKREEALGETYRAMIAHLDTAGRSP